MFNIKFGLVKDWLKDLFKSTSIKHYVLTWGQNVVVLYVYNLGVICNICITIYFFIIMRMSVLFAVLTFYLKWKCTVIVSAIGFTSV